MVGRAGEPRGSPGPFQPVVPTLYVSPPDDWNLMVVINLTEKVNPMAAITAEALSPVLHNQIPVITTDLLAQLYGVDVKNIQNNFARNADRFVAGKHFFKLTGSELKDLRPSLRGLQVSPKTRSLILWTERGAARHAKMLETDQAWEVFEKLEDCYFCHQKLPPASRPAYEVQTPNEDYDTRIMSYMRCGLPLATVPLLPEQIVTTIEAVIEMLRLNGYIVARPEELLNRMRML